jgi:hypothetical protein
MVAESEGQTRKSQNCRQPGSSPRPQPGKDQKRRKWLDGVEDPTVTPSFRIKLKLFHANFPDAQFRIVGTNKKYLSLKRKSASREGCHLQSA